MYVYKHYSHKPQSAVHLREHCQSLLWWCLIHCHLQGIAWKSQLQIPKAAMDNSG